MSLGAIFHRRSAAPNQPPNAAFYEWNSPSNSITIRLDVDAARRLASVVKWGIEALPTRGIEVGGLLLGRFTRENKPTTVIEDFELIESEHRRGPSYTLSEKDRGRLERRLSAHTNGQGLGVVGYWRSHTRPGLYLDQEDYSTILGYFTDSSQVFFLVKPSVADQNVGGFFFWEDGDIRREAPYAEFLFDERVFDPDHCIVSSPDRLPANDWGPARPAWPGRDPAGVENPERRSDAPPAPALGTMSEDGAAAGPDWADPSSRRDFPTTRAEISSRETARPGWPSPDLATPGDPRDNIHAAPGSTPSNDREPARSAWPRDPARVGNPERRSNIPTAPALRTQAEDAAAAGSDWASPARRLNYPRERARIGHREPARQPWTSPDLATAENPPALRDSPAARSAVRPFPLSAPRWMGLASAVVLMSILIGGALVIRSVFRPATTQAITQPAHTPTVHPLPPPDIAQRADARPGQLNEFSLNVEPTANSLRLWWNRDSPIIQNAPAGVLWVTDGTRHLRVDLDKRTLSSGSIVYVPTEGDVEFELDVPANGRLVSESARALIPIPTARASTSELRSAPPPSVDQTEVPPEPQQLQESARLRRPPGTTARRSEFIARADVKPFQPPASGPSPVRLDGSRAGALPPPPVLTPADAATHLTLELGKPYDRATITYEPVRPPMLHRVFQKLPGLRRLQRSEDGDNQEFIPPEPQHELTFLVPAVTGQKVAFRKPVNLKVSLNDSGKVTRVESLSKGPMAEVAAHAALAWQFTPARWKGKPVPSEMIVHLRFGDDPRSTAARPGRHPAPATKQ